MNYIDYILEFLIGEENKEYVNLVSYGWNENASLIIVPSNFFEDGVYLTAKSVPVEPVKTIDGIPFLFGESKVEKKNGKLYLYADIVASAFFLITRYEECVSRKQRDEHGRFLAIHSLQYRQGFLNRCVVDEYSALILKYLHELGVVTNQKKSGIRHIYLTHDVDNIWSWDSLFSALRSVGKRVLKRNDKAFTPLLAFFNYKKYDPIYTFPWIIETDNKYRMGFGIPTDIIYFVMGVKQKSLYDNAYMKKKKQTTDLILELEKKAQIGYHLSYTAKENGDKVIGELKNISEIVGHSIYLNRNHYLASKEPEDFDILIANGITDDFTMGFADHIGFRLSTCRPVKWINPISKNVTSLVLHTMTVMECTLDDYMGINDDKEALEKIMHLLSVIDRHGGDVVLLWHNQSFSPGRKINHRLLYINVLDNLLKKGQKEELIHDGFA